jgi:hypothetical protein
VPIRAEGQDPVVVVVPIEDLGPLLDDISPVATSLPDEVGEQGRHHPRERRVLVFEGVGLLVKSLHARRDVRRFVEGMTEDGIRGHDANDRQRDQREGDGEGVPLGGPKRPGQRR